MIAGLARAEAERMLAQIPEAAPCSGRTSASASAATYGHARIGPSMIGCDFGSRYAKVARVTLRARAPSGLWSGPGGGRRGRPGAGTTSAWRLRAWACAAGVPPASRRAR